MSDIVIAGYLGFANSGDEALLSIVLSEIKRRLPGKTVTVLSMKPGKTHKLYGVRARHRYNAAAINGEFSRGGVFLFGGGSLIQDVTSRRSLLYYLWLLRSAERHGMKTMLFANGLGPLLRESSRREAAEVLSNVDAITLRDRDSARLAEEIGVPMGRVTVTADTAFLLGGEPDGEGGHADPGVPEGVKYAVISYRPWKSGKTEYCEAASALCRHLWEKHGIAPLLVPMQLPCDMRTSKRIAGRAGVPVYIRRATLSSADAHAILSRAELTVGMRLHTLIFSAVAGTPMVGVSYDKKVESLCREMNVPCVGLDAGADELCRAADDVIERRAELAGSVTARAEAMAARAAETVDILASLFDSPDGGK